MSLCMQLHYFFIETNMIVQIWDNKAICQTWQNMDTCSYIWNFKYGYQLWNDESRLLSIANMENVPYDINSKICYYMAGLI